ncbi:glutathionylspermidine synthase family protein [Tuwongella immobilis]|uniref:Glutathionylspermidine synthase pre-ATP-grasp-like domain-containing protein n=1 Tax=Tuwongella immobilis TaxID=692036 RepID=A0A6C2YWI4_9BACT|nr:glutathionylspermidine synthase family protein [Tuwongella immobilis]VIP05727.1 Glutathionylspermidine synthase OS=Geobacter lovleyi (strain ATCC BAA-1151 / DSM 17278 / SZ) GN=Glov_2241 PE=4 SV=1: GSP_synth [Tuwongella immobilis]VTS08810.1 Glutathionylspermidine synthase OS=Geobacter lovleyi (strain ATCC BAA-1151 / DSM 17278 / SZ) GN=Glov_2241 PE=4 SV=1: GSP_synth [Tuwongella immobilis]
MQRFVHPPRLDYVAKLESHGMVYHTTDDGPYWDETAHYEFTPSEIDTLEAATVELDRICLEAVEVVLSQGRLGEFHIPEDYHDWIAESWERDERTINGRFDLCFDGRSPPKLLEYNADTPTGLLEAAVSQWFWLQDCHPHRQQFNSIHERLIEAWRAARHGRSGRILFTAMADHPEDWMTIQYLRDTAMQAGWETDSLTIDQLGWDGDRRCFTDQNENPIADCYKLYPWEWLFLDRFGPHLLEADTRWLEAPWKAILSNKAILPVLWELNPGHPNLLEAAHQPLPSGSYVQKPILSREGANIRIVENGWPIAQTQGPYTGPSIFQQLCKLPNFDGNYPVIGSWVVNGWPCGIGIREDRTLVTGNLSRFVPHCFG